MSRCFPYPPPGCSGKRLYDEALIESVKLQREREKAKAEKKKEKRREKKEKRIVKKEKARLNPSETSAHKLEDNLERSDLTEEHGQPIDSNNPCNSTDSTQNSNKRKRDSFFSNGSVRMPLQNQKEAKAEADALATENTTRIDSGSSFENEMQRLGWVFPPLKPEVDDLDWLFRRNIQDRSGTKRFKSGSEVSCCASSALWPRAQYLAEADVYTLPYTIPF